MSLCYGDYWTQCDVFDAEEDAIDAAQAYWDDWHPPYSDLLAVAVLHGDETVRLWGDPSGGDDLKECDR